MLQSATLCSLADTAESCAEYPQSAHESAATEDGRKFCVSVSVSRPCRALFCFFCGWSPVSCVAVYV